MTEPELIEIVARAIDPETFSLIASYDGNTRWYPEAWDANADLAREQATSAIQALKSSGVSMVTDRLPRAAERERTGGPDWSRIRLGGELP